MGSTENLNSGAYADQGGRIHLARQLQVACQNSTRSAQSFNPTFELRTG
jgi:hypothetical protein